MTIHKGQIGKEDIELGTGTFTRKGRTGSDVIITQLNLGHLPVPSLIKITNYTILNSDRVIFADNSSGAFTFTLPSILSKDIGIEYLIVKIDTSTNNLTIAGTINGDTNKTIQGQYSLVKVVAESSGYVITNVKGIVI